MSSLHVGSVSIKHININIDNNINKCIKYIDLYLREKSDHEFQQSIHPILILRQKRSSINASINASSQSINLFISHLHTYSPAGHQVSAICIYRVSVLCVQKLWVHCVKTFVDKPILFCFLYIVPVLMTIFYKIILLNSEHY